jgi:hypothetical protein
MAPVDTVKKQGSRFRKGSSGNPNGRPKGSRNVATLACEALLDGQAEALTQKAIEMALAGDVVAMKLCLERIYPPRKDRPVTFTLPPLASARDAADVSAAVTAAVSNGDITLGEAAEVAKLIDSFVRSYKTAELDNQIARAEQLSDAELLRIVRNGTSENTTPRLITVRSR